MGAVVTLDQRDVPWKQQLLAIGRAVPGACPGFFCQTCQGGEQLVGGAEPPVLCGLSGQPGCLIPRD